MKVRYDLSKLNETKIWLSQRVTPLRIGGVATKHLLLHTCGKQFQALSASI